LHTVASYVELIKIYYKAKQENPTFGMPLFFLVDRKVNLDGLLYLRS